MLQINTIKMEDEVEELITFIGVGQIAWLVFNIKVQEDIVVKEEVDTMEEEVDTMEEAVVSIIKEVVSTTIVATITLVEVVDLWALRWSQIMALDQ